MLDQYSCFIRLNRSDEDFDLEQSAIEDYDMGLSILPEFFVFLGVDVFVAMSLLTCLLDDHFPKNLPYLFQVAAIGGYVHILISKEFLTFFGSYMRFWYSFLFLAVALGNVIALNVYLAVMKKQWNLAKFFSAAVVFPTVLISGFFVFNYTMQLSAGYLLIVTTLFSALVFGFALSVFLSPQITKRIWKRR